MKRFGLVAMLAGLTAVAALSMTPPAQADEACGEKGQKSCPLQGWMEKNLQGPMEDGKMDALAKGLEKAASMAPDAAWNKGDKGWEKIAKDGAAAAKAGDKAGVKASCKTCHKEWRKQYKAQHRMKPVKG